MALADSSFRARHEKDAELRTCSTPSSAFERTMKHDNSRPSRYGVRFSAVHATSFSTGHAFTTRSASIQARSAFSAA
jgi:hypothetical protein